MTAGPRAALALVVGLAGCGGPAWSSVELAPIPAAASCRPLDLTHELCSWAVGPCAYEALVRSYTGEPQWIVTDC